jgi:RimJ/RimL family protein N-acetyltransferase
MNILFRPTDYSSDQDCEAFARWMNDPVLRDLWLPKGAKTESLATAASVRERYSGKDDSPWRACVDEVAVLNGKVVGQLSMILNPPHRKSSVDRVLWPSLIIGEASLLGSGAVRRFMARIRSIAEEMRVRHLEVGVFEFNQPMRNLLEKTGFREFARVEGVAESEGRLWADIRYSREISREIPN